MTEPGIKTSITANQVCTFALICHWVVERWQKIGNAYLGKWDLGRGVAIMRNRGIFTDNHLPYVSNQWFRFRKGSLKYYLKWENLTELVEIVSDQRHFLVVILVLGGYAFTCNLDSFLWWALPLHASSSLPSWIFQCQKEINIPEGQTHTDSALRARTLPRPSPRSVTIMSISCSTLLTEQGQRPSSLLASPPSPGPWKKKIKANK